MPKLFLPKNYLSYSQWSLWKKNKDRYIKEYFENSDKLNTKYLRFGSEFAKTLEVQHGSAYFPELKTHDSSEHEIICEIRGVPIIAYIDSYNTKLNIFDEYKTGKTAWTESKVQKHEQLPFYATVLKAKYGTMPEYCTLRWFETKDGEQEGLCNDVEFTGYDKSFKREFDEREITRIEESIEKVAYEISESYKQYLENLEL